MTIKAFKQVKSYTPKLNRRLFDYISLSAAIIFGLIISTTSAYLLAIKQEETKLLNLKHQATVYSSHVDNTLTNSINTLYNIRGVFNASNKVDLDEFNTFTDPILKNSTFIQALEWIPLVKNKNRIQHEKSGKDLGHKEYAIKHKSPNGEIISSPTKEKYFPVFYVNPETGNANNIGFDLSSNKNNNKILNLAQDTTLPIATAPKILEHSKRKQLGLHVFLAVYKTTPDDLKNTFDRRENLLGFVLAIYRVNDFFIYTSESIKNTNLSVNVVDTSNPLSKIKLFKSLEPNNIHHTHPESLQTQDNEFSSSSSIKIAGRNWKLTLHEHQLNNSIYEWGHLFVFIIGLIFTGFIALYILSNQKKRITVEQLVKDRTKELEHVKNEAQQVLENTSEGIFGTNTSGKITFVNPSALAITGYTENVFLNKNFHTLLQYENHDHTLYNQEDNKILTSVLNGKRTHSDQEVFWHKDGTAIQIEYTATPILNNGTVIGGFITFRDIRVRKKNEQNLIDARLQAESASSAKSTFLATMSHEIRTPLNGMLGMAQLLSSTKLDNKQQHHINTLIQSGGLLLNLINDILDFSRIEANKLELDIHDFNLKQTCLDTIELMISNANEKEINLDLSYDEKSSQYVTGDNHRIQQILINLIGNSIKFTSKGEIKLQVSSTAISEEHALFTFQVTDTGIGIKKDKLEHLFDSFTQADTSTTRKFGGSGLGLTISKRLCDLMKGDITVTSTPGEGSTFKVSIPLLLSSEEKISTEETRDENLYFNGHILLVEDNLVNTMIASEMLTSLGLTFTTVENGEQAVERFKHEQFDLILMDCQMPVMDGYSATRSIRELSNGIDIPILALTANVLPEDIKQCYDSGMNDCLHKPIDLDKLQKGLKAWLVVA